MTQPNPITATEGQHKGPAFLFDLDGSLVDSVYQHVLSWRDALEGAGIELAVWRIPSGTKMLSCKTVRASDDPQA